MPRIHRQALVPYSAEAMFDLVNDVASYPQFLRWCQATRVLSSDAQHMRAEMRVGVGGANQRIVTDNTLARPRSIALKLVSGPLRSLEGLWQFSPLESGEPGCKVRLDVAFTMQAGLFSIMFSKVLDTACSTMVESFVQRAKTLYPDV